MKFDEIEHGVDYIWVANRDRLVARADSIRNGIWLFNVLYVDIKFNISNNDSSIRQIKPLVVIDELIKI